MDPDLDRKVPGADPIRPPFNCGSLSHVRSSLSLCSSPEGQGSEAKGGEGKKEGKKQRQSRGRMPELPEVEAARRAIEENCVGKNITRCSVADDPKVIDGVSPSHLQSSLAGRTILAALHKGKNLWLRLDSLPFPTFQFGMAGAIYIKGVAVTKYKRSAVSLTDEWPSKYSKVFTEGWRFFLLFPVRPCF